MNSIRIAVAGGAGRMGRTLIRAVSEAEGMRVTGAFEASGSPEIGKDSGALAGIAANGVTVGDDALSAIANADVLLDFTRPAVSVHLAALCAQARICHVLGTTGLSTEDDKKIGAAARHAAIVKSGNMSMGVNLLAALVKKAAKALPGFDIEIVEMHHRQKIDAPSGTALQLGRAAAEGRSIALDENSIRGRDGVTGPRPQGAIGFVSLRGGTVIGDHDVIFAGPGERIVLSHVAEDRAIFAHGALAAARWGHGRKPGLYSMADVLGVAD
jgi:4-hydroxy-tetrahydrodipicolinate reductase